MPMNLLSARDRLRLEREKRATAKTAALTPQRTGEKAIRADQGKAG